VPAEQAEDQAGVAKIILGPQDARDKTIILGEPMPLQHVAGVATLASSGIGMVTAEVPPNIEQSLANRSLLDNSLNKALRSPLGNVSVIWHGAGSHIDLHEPVIALLVGAFVVVVLFLFAMSMGRFWKWIYELFRHSEEKELREYVEGLHRSPGLEVVNQLVAGGVYDCAIMRPLASKQLLRLEARVEEAASGFCLWTPLTQQACVRFTAAVSRNVTGASLPAPMSYQCSSIDFVISLLDAPHVRIEIEGRDLSTFDMVAGRLSAKRTFDSAARHWQEFAMTHQISGNAQPPARFRSEHTVLEFQETAIVLGTSITVIGELQRNAVGTLLLRPCVDNAAEDSTTVKQESWMTSWETARVKEQSPWRSFRNALRKPWFGKVWVSDDPTLLGANHKHSKYEPSKSSRDCSSSLVNLLQPAGQ